MPLGPEEMSALEAAASGTATTAKEAADALAAAKAPAPPLVTFVERDMTGDLLDHLRASIDLSEEVAAQVKEGKPLPAEEVRAAEQWKERAMKDEAWVKRYLAGDTEAVRQMTLASIVASLGTEGSEAQW